MPGVSLSVISRQSESESSQVIVREIPGGIIMTVSGETAYVLLPISRLAFPQEKNRIRNSHLKAILLLYSCRNKVRNFHRSDPVFPKMSVIYSYPILLSFITREVKFNGLLE